MNTARKVMMRVNPGEPTDGSGRVCIHLFVQDEAGPFVEPHVLHPVIKDGEPEKRKYEIRPTRGRLACDSKRTVAPVTRDGITLVTPRTDDARAVTCPKCKNTEFYTKAMDLFPDEELE